MTGFYLHAGHGMATILETQTASDTAGQASSGTRRSIDVRIVIVQRAVGTPDEEHSNGEGEVANAVDKESLFAGGGSLDGYGAFTAGAELGLELYRGPRLLVDLTTRVQALLYGEDGLPTDLAV